MKDERSLAETFLCQPLELQTVVDETRLSAGDQPGLVEQFSRQGDQTLVRPATGEGVRWEIKIHDTLSNSI